MKTCQSEIICVCQDWRTDDFRVDSMRILTVRNRCSLECYAVCPRIKFVIDYICWGYSSTISVILKFRLWHSSNTGQIWPYNVPSNVNNKCCFPFETHLETICYHAVHTLYAVQSYILTHCPAWNIWLIYVVSDHQTKRKSVYVVSIRVCRKHNIKYLNLP